MGCQTAMIPPFFRGPELTVEIVLNGESVSVPEGLTVAGLLNHLRVDPARVAVEVNRQLIRKEERSDVGIAAGAEVEVVHFVGGGYY